MVKNMNDAKKRVSKIDERLEEINKNITTLQDSIYRVKGE
jgi:tetrahydromethanopterin S-methyltransferase subunit G